MAADTAYLEGGPCDGQTKKITVSESDSGTIICKGSEYLNDNGKKRPNGDIIFLFRAKVPTPPTTTTTISAPRAHGGWSDLQRSMNTKWPKSLNHSGRLTRASLRSLQRMHKVKG
jgi:hypothetical protein